MNYKLEKKEKDMSLFVAGRIDTTTAPQLEEKILAEIDGVENLVLDFKELEYISSAGLRLLLLLKKKMNATGGTFKILNVNDFVMEVFEMTGFKDILDIE